MKLETKRILIMWAIIAAIALFASFCTPQKRLARLVKNHPELIRVDTIRIRDTLFLPGSFADTATSLLAAKTDTVVMIHNNIITKAFVYHDSIYIASTALPDTIVKTVQVPYKYVQAQDSEPWYNTFWWRLAFQFLPVSILLLILSKRTEK